MFRWGNETCTVDDFSVILTEMGKCYVFNGGPGYVSNGAKRQVSPGTNKGLRIVLDAQHWMYTEEELIGVEEAGIKFLVSSGIYFIVFLNIHRKLSQ